MENKAVHNNEEVIMPTTTVGIDSILEKAAAIGVPAALYVIAVMVSGQRGACAVTSALKALGFGKMKYGVASLIAASQLSEETAHMAVKIPSKQALKQRLQDGEEEASVLRSVDQLPLSGDMKQELKKFVHAYCKKRAASGDRLSEEGPDVDCQEEGENHTNDEPPTCYACGGECPDDTGICPRVV